MKVFITGMTGTLGTALAKLHSDQGDEVVGCARSEARSAVWLSTWNKQVVDTHRFATLYLFDCRDLAKRRTKNLLAGVDRLYHCAAMKHVDLCEKWPSETYRQNVGRTDIISTVCQELGIPLTFVSSDKACMPQGVYGATKLIGERLVLARGGAVVRLGNLIGSSGSVFALWKQAVAEGKHINLTDPLMTRYFIEIPNAAKIVHLASECGRITVPHDMRAVVMGSVARELVVHPDLITITGKRPGETQHQWLLSPEENGGHGLCSSTAPRWNVSDLLHEAGCA